MQEITSDTIIEILSGEPYTCDKQNDQFGKRIRLLMESLGWEYSGEIRKCANGQETTAALYKKDSQKTQGVEIALMKIDASTESRVNELIKSLNAAKKRVCGISLAIKNYDVGIYTILWEVS